MKSGNLNFLKPSGPLQVCNGTAARNLNFLGPSGPLQACNGVAVPLYLYIVSVSAPTFAQLIMYYKLKITGFSL
jgi:hypothetical protein